MNSATLSSMPTDPPLNEPPVPQGTALASWRKPLWCVLALLAITPPTALIGLAAGMILFTFAQSLGLYNFDTVIALGLASILVVPVAYIVMRAGLKREWPGRNAQLIGWSVAATLSLVLCVAVGFGVGEVRRSSKHKAMIPRQLAAAADQFWLEHGPFKVFIRHEDLFGPQRYIKGYNPADGENPADQFPLRFGWTQPYDVLLPDGTKVRRAEIFSSVGKSGIVATYPLPQDETGGNDPNRVYRLSDGTTFRRNRVVKLPPDPAGLEGRDQDGVHTYAYVGGTRLEITYRGGVPDGPFRAYRANGRLWVEATYVRGRVVGPAWHHLPDGSKFDELTVTLEEALRLTQPPPAFSAPTTRQ